MNNSESSISHKIRPPASNMKIQPLPGVLTTKKDDSIHKIQSKVQSSMNKTKYMNVKRKVSRFRTQPPQPNISIPQINTHTYNIQPPNVQSLHPLNINQSSGIRLNSFLIQLPLM
eukprot:UN00188